MNSYEKPMTKDWFQIVQTKAMALGFNPKYLRSKAESIGFVSAMRAALKEEIEAGEPANLVITGMVALIVHQTKERGIERLLFVLARGNADLYSASIAAHNEGDSYVDFLYHYCEEIVKELAA